MKEKSAIDWVIWILVIIGALNWGLIGLAGLIGSGSSWNIVDMIFGSIPMLANIIYLLVGLSGIWLLIKMFK